MSGVHLLVPVKPLRLAKSRLRGAADGGAGDPGAHAQLVAAVAVDTVLAARRARGVTEVVCVTSDRALTRALASEGVRTVEDVPASGLNAALRHGDQQLRREGAARTGALQADLPALDPEELAAALAAAGGDRAFCPDRQGTGTTLLLAGAGQPLDPRFGPGSAGAHAASEAKELDGTWSTLRCDVDTAADLALAADLGLGPRTRAFLESA